MNIESLIDTIAARVADHLIARGYRVAGGDMAVPPETTADPSLTVEGRTHATADGRALISGDVKDNTAPATGRRRRASSPTTATSDTSASVTGTEPSVAQAPTGRRRRGQSEANPMPAPASATSRGPTNAPVETAGGTRRRRASSAAGESPKTNQKTTISPSDDKITDADLLKAASAAAQKITPDGVKDVVRQYARNGQLNDIPADNRREFLNELKVKVSVS